jgi:predicted nucleotidyltransferase
MDIFLESHKKFLTLLLTHQVDFILIGGYAVIVYGYERGTSDMDLWLKPSNENKEKFIVALREHGISEQGLAQLNLLDFTGDPRVFHIGEKPAKIDFLTKVQGLKFEEAYEVKKLLPLYDLMVPVIQYDHLILLKMIAGRPQDKADIDVLSKIHSKK